MTAPVPGAAPVPNDIAALALLRWVEGIVEFIPSYEIRMDYDGVTYQYGALQWQRVIRWLREQVPTPTHEEMMTHLRTIAAGLERLERKCS